MIKVEVLGTGGAFDPFSTAYLINDHVLVDCGMEVVKELIATGKLAKVDHLFLTHLHQDHVAGLELLIYYRRYFLGKTGENAKEFTIHAGADFFPYYAQLKCSYGNTGIVIIDFEIAKHVYYATPIDVPEPTDSHKVPSAYLMQPVVHCNGSVTAFALRVYDANSESTVLISGDTDGALNLEDYGVDLTKPNTLVFHDMGWTGLDHITLDKCHPTEREVFVENGESGNLIGVHTARPLSVYRMADKNEIFTV